MPGQKAQTQRTRAYTAECCTMLAHKYASRRARFHLRIAEDDPPSCSAQWICTLKNWWSTAPPHNMNPASAGEARAGPHLARRFVARGGDG